MNLLLQYAIHNVKLVFVTAKLSKGGEEPSAPLKLSRIADPEGRTVPLGTQGELCFRGYMVMRGYWNDEAQTRQTIDAAGWLHSGDLGVMDAEGYITITGRSKDMVIRGGKNIYPREIEEFLFKHPSVADAQVFGVPDEHYGEWKRLHHLPASNPRDVGR